MKSQIIIFETGKDIGIMSSKANFYKKDTSQKEREALFHEKRLKVGEKYKFNGNHILRANQKSPIKKLKYKDGKYILITEKYMQKEDYYQEQIPTDILIISNRFKKVAIGNPQADCPIVICEDRKKGYTALAHCGASYINRKLPVDIIKAMKDCCNSNIDDLYIYIGTCISKDNYIYDTYPTWATNRDVWKRFIVNKQDGYHINMLGAIKKQLKDLGIKHIRYSKKDTYTDDNYYSHVAAHQGNKNKLGQNFVGFYYK